MTKEKPQREFDPKRDKEDLTTPGTPAHDALTGTYDRVYREMLERNRKKKNAVGSESGEG